MSKKEEKLMKEIRKRYPLSREHVKDNYDRAIADVRFCLGGKEQWDDTALKRREGRPVITINKVENNVQHLIGEFRSNRPAIKVKPVDSESDPELAEVQTGLIRSIEQRSCAEVAYDTAYEGVCRGGFGAFRVLADYSDDDAWEQDLKVERVTNPFAISWDPSSKTFIPSQGARWLFFEDELTKEDYEEQYPGKVPFDFETDLNLSQDWKGEGEKIKIAEYFRKVPVEKTLYLVDGGEQGLLTLEELPEGVEVLNTREVTTHKLEWYKVDGKQVLEGPIELPSKNIPVVVVIGKEMNVDGKQVISGVVREAKEPARIYNYMWSSDVEAIALSPKAPYIASAKQIANTHDMWRTANSANHDVLIYDPDPEAPGPPQRTPPAQYNSAADRAMALASDDIKSTMNIFDASRGARSNENSGVAINARVRQGNIANFTYTDNMMRGIEYGGRVLLEMIPHIYDTQRIVRTLGVDGAEDFVEINKQTMDGVIVNDITSGKYDLVVSAGPSYATQREEAVASQMDFLRVYPAAAGLVGDLITKNMDWPQADEFAERLKKVLPPGLVEPEEGEEPPPPPPPSPIEQAEGQKVMQEVKQGEQEIQQNEVELAIKMEQLEEQKLKTQKTRIEIENMALDTVEKRDASIIPNE